MNEMGDDKKHIEEIKPAAICKKTKLHGGHTSHKQDVAKTDVVKTLSLPLTLKPTDKIKKQKQQQQQYFIIITRIAFTIKK